jgi:hypothetical protein
VEFLRSVSRKTKSEGVKNEAAGEEREVCWYLKELEISRL